MDAMDRFQRQAFEFVTGGAAARRSTSARSRRSCATATAGTTWGQSTLLARRLVEAGCTFVTVHFGGWDHHWDLQSGMEDYLPMVDAAVSSLFRDLAERGLYDPAGACCAASSAARRG